jgi:tRNA(fMet)-specific endonuclease VapC
MPSNELIQTTGKIIFDSSALIKVARGDQSIWEKTSAYSIRATTGIAVAELLAGAKASDKPSENLAAIRRLIAPFAFLYPDRTTSDYYSDIWIQLRRSGRPIPTNDIWIAALCLQHGLPLAANDEHFRSVQGLTLIFS